ncbi:thioesterase II family protein [Streptomyces sedi]|uniref:Thioesterase n=1 Tax=Streptomyces sedi TaxID=555059 RepID=A0A5C4V8P5_9ACTN|nr:thioesterase domain-containing protein [Streptomyces sedi]TNM32197.1 thioesterase [Streptomyces sedi]
MRADGPAGESPWFRHYRGTRAPRVRLAILPHAGGTAAFYHEWGEAFGPDVEVLVARYPGRQQRLHEPCIDRMEPLANEVTGALLPFTDLPLAIFGHSMGASLGYEVALRLEKLHGVRLDGLCVSARAAPHRVAPRDEYLADDATLLAEVRRLGGTDGSVLDDPEMRELLLPAIRADFAVVGTYRPRAPMPVSCPVVAYAGADDPSSPVDGVRAWGDVAPAGFTLRVLTGDHFYLVGRRAEVVADLRRRLLGAREVAAGQGLG